MARFDKKILQTLRRAGWHPNRHTDTAAVAAQAAACGYVVGEKPAAFLREFDGLSLEFSERDFLFEFRVRTEYLTRERLAYIAAASGKKGWKSAKRPMWHWLSAKADGCTASATLPASPVFWADAPTRAWNLSAAGATRSSICCNAFSDGLPGAKAV